MAWVSGSGDGRRDAKRRQQSQLAKSAPLDGRRNCKHRGDIFEMQFMIEASNRGFGGDESSGDNGGFDVILDRGGRRIWRVQVRGSGYVSQNGFCVRTCWRTCGKQMPYTQKQIDFLAAVFCGQRNNGQQFWYLIPVCALGGRLNITLYPFGTRHDRHPPFEKYREAWNLLGQPGPRE